MLSRSQDTKHTAFLNANDKNRKWNVKHHLKTTLKYEIFIIKCNKICMKTLHQNHKKC